MKVCKVVLEKDSETSKGKKKKYKSLALKAKKVSSDEEASCSDGDDEEYAMAIRYFKKFFRRRGKFVQKPHDDKNFRRAKEEKKGKEERKCFKCGDLNHFISDCPKHSFNDQKAFVGGCWSDSEEVDDSKKDEICLMALDNNEVRLKVKLEPDEWIKDRGCSRHMTGNKDLFSSYEAINRGFSLDQLLNTPKSTPPPLTSPPPDPSQPSKHNSSLAINLEPMELIFSTPPTSPHPFFDSLEYLPPWITNPPPPQPPFEIIEHLANQPPPLPVMEPPLPTIPPQLSPMCSNNAFPILTHKMFWEHCQRTQVIVNDLRDRISLKWNMSSSDGARGVLGKNTLTPACWLKFYWTNKVHWQKIPESPWGSPIPIGDGDGDVNRFPDGDGDGDGDEAKKRGWGWFQASLQAVDVDVSGTIVVMIGRMWDVNAITGRYFSTDFVVSDSKGNMIHCTARGSIAHNFLRLKEGSVYSIKNFVVHPNKDEFRIMKNDTFMLEFDGSTTIRKVSVSTVGFIRYPFHMVDFDWLEATNKVLDWTTYHRGQSVRVTLWGGLGDVLIKKKTKHVGMSATVLTSIELEQTIKGSRADSSEPKELTLENVLIWARNCKNDSATFHCKVMIENARTRKGWNYPSCGGDNYKKGATRQGGRFFCEACNKVIEYPVLRYRLELGVADDILAHVVCHRLCDEFGVADDTAHVVVILFDEPATELLGYIAESLLETVDEVCLYPLFQLFPNFVTKLSLQSANDDSGLPTKVNPPGFVEEDAGSSALDSIVDSPSTSLKRLSKDPTMSTPTKCAEENRNKKGGVSKDLKPKEKRKRSKLRYSDDDSGSEWLWKQADIADGYGSKRICTFQQHTWTTIKEQVDSMTVSCASS
ncbi:zf-CCHC domain-containing protein [Tanacetum coccineum]